MNSGLRLFDGLPQDPMMQDPGKGKGAFGGRHPPADLVARIAAEAAAAIEQPAEAEQYGHSHGGQAGQHMYSHGVQPEQHMYSQISEAGWPQPRGAPPDPPDMSAEAWSMAAQSGKANQYFPPQRSWPPPRGHLQEWPDIPDPKMMDAISAAQSEAASRRKFDIRDAQSLAAGNRFEGKGGKGRGRGGRGMSAGGYNGIDNMIRRAQNAAAGNTRISTSKHFGISELWVPEDMSAQDFLGNWVDSHGNSVMVYSTDAFVGQLTAAITRPNKRDTILTIKQMPDMSWSCGNSWLDTTQSSAERLQWVAGDGRVSIWTRGRK